ncbi:PaaI family thioesterase [Paenibacillus sp. CMAA1364]
MEGLDSMIAKGKDTFWGYLGCEFISGNTKEVKISLEVKEHHLNSLGIVHGGVLSSLMDQAMGMVATAAKNVDACVTTNMNIHFVSPMRSGVLTVSAIVIHEAGRSLTTEARVHDSDGTLGCISTAGFRVVGIKK